MCARPLIFSNFEKDIDRNIFDVVFLESCYSRLSHEPMELYDKDKSSIDCFLHYFWRERLDKWRKLACPSL